MAVTTSGSIHFSDKLVSGIAEADQLQHRSPHERSSADGGVLFQL